MGASNLIFIRFISAIIVFPMNLQLTDVKDCRSWTDIPSICRCERNCVVNCSSPDLLRPHKKYPECTSFLILSGNNMVNLQKDDFQWSESIDILRLTSSNITLVKNDTFENLPNLRVLYLYDNHILEIYKGTFSTNHHIRFLNLSNNPLEVLPSGAFDGLRNLVELHLSGNKLTSLEKGIFQALRKLYFLSISDNNLIVIKQVNWIGLKSLKYLYLGKNSLTELSFDSFGNINLLRKLYLNENKISAIGKEAFSNLSNLEELDLSGNKISAIEKEVFTNLNRLLALNLSGNELKNTKADTLEYLTYLRRLYFHKPHLCFLALKLKDLESCEPKVDAISSMYHLLDNGVLRVSVWVIACVACVGNIAVLVGRLVFFRKPNDVHSFYISNLALADLLMSPYLFVIAAHDVAYRDEYVLHAESWMHSWKCNFCGFVATFSSESSIFIMVVITIDRYMAIVHPLSVKKRTIPLASTVMALTWTIALLASALPLFNIDYYGDEYYRNNGMCLPLQIHDAFGPAWEYSTFLFCGVNLTAFLFIFCAYIKMFSVIFYSKIGLRCTQQQQDGDIAKRFAFIVGTDFFCWVPIILVKIVALLGDEKKI